MNSNRWKEAMKKRKKLTVNHYTMPLRRIVRVEKQNGDWFVVLECRHASPGKPASKRYSRWYPCPFCAVAVKAAKDAYATPVPDLMSAFRANLRKRLKGGTFR